MSESQEALLGAAANLNDEEVCKVCWISQPRSRFYGLDCGHLFCCECIGRFLAEMIRERRLNSLKCLELDCQVVYRVEHVRRFCTDRVFSLYGIAS